MKSRAVIAGVLLGSLVVTSSILASARGTAVAAAAAPPNVVVIMTDDQTAESLRVMERTRAMIGAEGASFDESFVNLPLCCPSRATFLTGLYAHNHEITTNSAPFGGFYVFDREFGSSNLATALEGAGYYTAMVGKHLNSYGDEDSEQVPAGWSEWYATLEPNPDVYEYRLNENGTVVSYGSEPADYKADVLSARAVEVISRRAPAPAPLFMWLSYTNPHGGGPNPNPQPPADCDQATKPAPRHATAFDEEPLPTPPSFNEDDVSDKPPSIQAMEPLDAAEIENVTRRYRCTLESLQSVDEGIAQVLTALEASGELDQTLIVFTSDNGFFNGEHRLAQGKGRHYEPATRVPLLLRGPGVPAGMSVVEPVTNADLAPTILGAAGVPPPVEPDGISLLDALGPGGDSLRDALLIENRNYAGIRTESHLYLEYSGGNDEGAIELYDLDADPHQLENLHGRPGYASLEAELASRLASLRRCAGADCRPADSDPLPPPDQTTPEGPPAPPPDTDPPETTITKGAPNKTEKHKVKFKFESNEPGSIFQCKFDKKRLKPCSSPRTYKRLDDGKHKFKVFAIDAAGNVGAAAKDKFKVVD